MTYRKPLALLVAAGAAASLLSAAPVANASSPAPAAPSVGDEVGPLATSGYSFLTSWTRKKRSGEFKMTREGSVMVIIDEKQYNHRVDMRIITCSSHVGFTDWRQVPAREWKTMTLDGKPRTLPKGTCFKVETKPTMASKVTGRVYH